MKQVNLIAALLLLSVSAIAQTVTPDPGPYTPMNQKYQYRALKVTEGLWNTGKLVQADSAQFSGVTYVPTVNNSDSTTKAANTAWVKRFFGINNVFNWNFTGNFTPSDPTTGRLGFRDSTPLHVITNDVIRLTVPENGITRSAAAANKILLIDTITKRLFYGDASSGSGFVPYTGATQDVNLGEFGLQTGNVQFDNTPTSVPTAAGTMNYNDADGTVDLRLKGGNVSLQIGQESVVRVVNKTATNINLLESNYQAVRVTGAQGQRLKVDLAQATTDTFSAETIGLVTETINNNEEGFITTSGLVRNINTTGSLQSETWADGDILYLSPTVAGRITKVKPVAPNHLVVIGYVIRAHATQGSIFVKVDNGYELNELHNVKIVSPTNKQGLVYNDTTDVWENKSVLNISDTSAMLRRYLDTLQAHNTRIISAGGGGGGSTGWALTGNASAVTDFLGTTNNRTMRFRTNNVERMVIDSIGNFLFGNTTVTGTATPLNVSFGNTFGNNTAGSAANLKWDLFTGTVASDRYGIGMSSSLMEIRAGLSASIGMYVNNGVQAARFSNNGNTMFGTSVNPPLALVSLGGTTANTKLAIFDNGTQTIGLGVAGGQFRLHLNETASRFSFLNTPTGTEIFTIKGTGEVGINNINPVASAVIDMVSTTRGLLIPRMTLTQRNAIASPAAGLQVIVTGETGGEFVSMYNSSLAAWQRVGAVAGSNTQIQYNNAGALGASPTFSYDDALKSLKVDSIYIYQGRNRNAGNVVVGRNEGVAGVPLSTITTGTNNTGLGTSVLANITSAVNNIGIGYYSLRQDTTGSSNIGIGTFALTSLRNGSNNTAIGIAALQTITTASGNVAIGTNASTNLTAGNSNNTVVGNDAHGNASTGAANVFIGKGAGQFAGGADLNAIVGMNAMQLGSGDQTAAIGYEAGLSTTGNNNTYAGFNAGKNITSGANNTVIGSQSGSALGITTGSNNTIIGAGVNGLATTLANNIVIADGAGNQRINANSSGSVGIGTGVTIAASARLEITSTTQGVLFPRMTTAQKTAIGTPAAGLQVYDTTLNQMSYFNGTTWVNF